MLFWIAVQQRLHLTPSPMPNSSMNVASCQYGVSTPIVDSRNNETINMIAPKIGNFFYRPVLSRIRPAMIDDTRIPATAGSIASPDCVAVYPFTACR